MDMATATHTVKGMTCGHRVGAVQEEAGEVAGVAAVQADPASGRPAVNSDDPAGPAKIAAAVREAGHEAVGRP